MAEEEVAWAAGLFEGEGSFPISRKKGSSVLVVNASLRMTDRDVVERFAAIVGCGQIYDLKPQKAGWKPVYLWTAASRSDVLAVADLLEPWLGARRKQRIARVREVLELPRCSVCGKKLRRRSDKTCASPTCVSAVKAEAQRRQRGRIHARPGQTSIQEET